MDQDSYLKVFGQLPIHEGVYPIIEDSTVWMHGEEIEKLKRDYGVLNLRVSQLESLVKLSIGLSIKINDLNSSKYSLKESITLIINKENDYFIAEAADLDIYGVGETEREAINSFKIALISYYESLSDLKGKLSKKLKVKLKLLRRFVYNEDKKI